MNETQQVGPVAPLVRVVDVWKTYGDGVSRLEVLRGVDFLVDPGETVAVVGPSGSGKSTLLYLLGALDRPDSGAVEIGGVDLGKLDPSARADFRNRAVGFVFQFHELLADFSLLENVMMPGMIAGLARKRLLDRALDLLSEVGMVDRRGDFPSRLSGGERQRVAICRALLLEPPLLLADEPTGNLDEENGQVVLDLLFDLRERLGTAAVVVTHNAAVAQRCARVLELRSGLLRPR